jgi:hypothetical protein
MVAPFGSSETGRHRSYDISYPAARKPTALIRSSVLLEMGTRGGEHPHERIAIGSLLADVLGADGTRIAEFTDLEPFEVAVLHPGRTLLEKLVHIHALAQRLAREPAQPAHPREGRHFYDVFRLLSDHRVLDLLSDRAQIGHVMESIQEITSTFFDKNGSSEIRPEGGFATCPAFDPQAHVSQRLRAAYETGMPELYFGSARLPTWDDICRRVKAVDELP